MPLNRPLNRWLLLFLLTPGCGYAASEVASSQQSLCSSDWYKTVEEQVLTGDGSGHGPDPGSEEWRSVVEFKLSIRGNPDIPPRNTDQWCDYINRHFIR